VRDCGAPKFSASNPAPSLFVVQWPSLVTGWCTTEALSRAGGEAPAPTCRFDIAAGEHVEEGGRPGDADDQDDHECDAEGDDTFRLWVRHLVCWKFDQ